MAIPDHLTCLLRNLYAGQEAIVRTGHGTAELIWNNFEIGKGVCQGCMLLPCLFNLNAYYIKQNAGLDESQTGIKIARRNIKNLTYADYATLIEERTGSKEPLDEGERGDCKAGLKLNIQKVKIMASSPITSWHTDEETKETVTDFLGSKITVDGDCNNKIKRCLLLGRKDMTNLGSVLKSRDITLLTKIYSLKATVFPAFM